ncbi:MAG TPA: ClpXP protease specificity-enhancing factor [Burkholderiales bacterium]|nr:ClpXP protease specificity-enhancing factor [Burkholderiales bacterium]
MKEASKTPYLIRAIFEWCCDSGLTPYIAVKVDETTKVPMEYVKNGEIVLNVSPDATRNLKIGNDLLQFSARFAGVSREVSVPINMVSSIFAKENGQGMSFRVSPAPPAGGPARPDRVPPNDDRPAPPAGGRPKLQVIK